MRFLVFFLCFLYISPFSALASSFDIVLVTDICGLGDNGLNDRCWLGIQQAARELGLKAKVVQSFKQDDYFLNLYESASEGNIIVTAGFLMSDPLLKVASLCPGKKFLLIDGEVESANVKSILFKDEEIGFLAGLLASAITKVNKVGYLGGVKASRNDKFLIGYKAGIKIYSKLVGKDVEVLESYVGTFNDPEKGKEAGKFLFGQGVDVIFQVAGKSGLGILEVAKEREKEFFVIGVDLDRGLVNTNSNVLNIVRRVDLATYLAIISLAKVGFNSEVCYMGLREGVFSVEGIPALKRVIPQEILSLIENIKEKLIAGKILVPSTMEELLNLFPPEKL
ncbi:MAG: BMP family ABC transporter substrate-binding protein [Synergistetes bacterium]|nr:BMP family ABC transporter substrate-binding protein [Synergistota bacterium]MCX8127661.1 BMP family ABC transporter substrate-binding protein [Synergistota bacterium]MDW8191424.1 BMP family ABC transporter substrate-binding protein [Synergistota bacterium]